MLIKERKIILLLFVIVFFVFKTKAFARPIEAKEKTRLYNSIKTQNYVDRTIDVSLTEQVVTGAEAVNKMKQKRAEETEKLRKESKDDSITLVSVGIALSGGNEIRLSEKRVRIGDGRIRIDTTIFANEEMTATNYESTTISNLFDRDAPSYRIDHKLKQAFINNLRWSSGGVLRFGKVDEDILIDIIRLCHPERHTSTSKNELFSYRGTGNINGKVVDEIECVDPNGKVKYSISLDSDDWRICHKIVRYDDKSSLVSKTVEYQGFTKVGGSSELFPRLVTRQYFDKEGKEEKVEVVYITDVMIGLPIPEDVFKLDVPTDYTIVDNRPKVP